MTEKEDRHVPNGTCPPRHYGFRYFSGTRRCLRILRDLSSSDQSRNSSQGAIRRRPAPASPFFRCHRL